MAALRALGGFGTLAAGSLHPVNLKKIMAGEVTAAEHGVEASMKAHEDFAAQFSSRRYSEVGDLPVLTDLSQTVVEAVRGLGFATSDGEVRRMAEQTGLRLVLEPTGGGEQHQSALTANDIRLPLGEVLESRLEGAAGDCYLRAGRRLARIIR